MPTPLLTTKFYYPPPRPDLIPRPRLIEQLNAGSSRKLTLISSPAGFGKTTLLSDWAQYATSRTRVTWLSLDESDNDLKRFLFYFIAALQIIESQVGQGILTALQSPGKVNIEGVLTGLVNEINEFSDDMVLILDDYHVIDSQPIDQAITFLIENLPPQMHLVIASRIDPSWPLARLRARGQMTEIRADDLRFSPDEAADFFNRAMGFDLSPQDAAALEERTEGWITGLQLAALSMQSSDDLQDFVQSFTGSNRYILDYLGEEVLSHQSQNIHDFLLQTSILNRLTGPLCDAVLGASIIGTSNSEGQETLESLERENLFIVPLDDKRHWYRYHHLFADLLNRRLKQIFPDLVPELHQRASIWFQSEGYLIDAFQHALNAGNTSRATELLEARWQVYINRGEFNELKRMMDALGPEITKGSAPLSMAYCWLYSMAEVYDAIPPHLENVRQALKAGAENGVDQSSMKYKVLPTLIETMEATISYENGDPSAAKRHAQIAASLIPPDANLETRGLLKASADFWLALAHQGLGEIDQACAVYIGIMEMMKIGQNQMGAANAVMEVAMMYQQLGKTSEIITLCEDMLAYISKQGWEKLPPSGIVHLILAMAQADIGEFENAQNNLMIGQELVEPIKTSRYSNLITQIDSKIHEDASPKQPLVEPLSQRELEVLELIAQGLSNREISERLYLALSTIKGHNRNIFDKLQVQRRTEAVVRAHELGLLKH